MANTDIAKILAELDKPFRQGVFPRCDISHKEAPEALAVVKRHMPELFPSGEMGLEQTRDFLTEMERDHPVAFIDGEVAWEPLVRTLANHGSAHKDVHDIAARLEEQSRSILVAGMIDTEGAALVLSRVGRAIPGVFPQIKITHGVADKMLAEMKQLFPRTFSEGQASLKMLVTDLYRLHKATSHVADRYLRETQSEFNDRFSDAFPVHDVDDECARRVVERVRRFALIDTPPSSQSKTLLIKQFLRTVNAMLINEMLIKNAALPVLIEGNSKLPLRDEEDLRRSIDELIQRHRSAFFLPQVHKELDNEAAQYIFNNMKRQLPNAFPYGKVDWGQLTGSLANLSTRVETTARNRANKVLMQLQRKLPNPYPPRSDKHSIDNSQVLGILNVLRDEFPNAFSSEEIATSSQALTILEQLKHTLATAKAFSGRKIDWEIVVHYLHDLAARVAGNSERFQLPTRLWGDGGRKVQGT